jgi:hypothetical protein
MSGRLVEPGRMAQAGRDGTRRSPVRLVEHLGRHQLAALGRTSLISTEGEIKGSEDRRALHLVDRLAAISSLAHKDSSHRDRKGSNRRLVDLDSSLVLVGLGSSLVRVGLVSSLVGLGSSQVGSMDHRKVKAMVGSSPSSPATRPMVSSQRPTKCLQDLLVSSQVALAPIRLMGELINPSQPHTVCLGSLVA